MAINCKTFIEKSNTIIKDSNSELAKLSESLSVVTMPSIANHLQYDYKEDVSTMRVKSLKRGGVDY